MFFLQQCHSSFSSNEFCGGCWWGADPRRHFLGFWGPFWSAVVWKTAERAEKVQVEGKVSEMEAADARPQDHCSGPNHLLPLNLVQGVDWVARHGHCDRRLELFPCPCPFWREFVEVSFCYPRHFPCQGLSTLDTIGAEAANG